MTAPAPYPPLDGTQPCAGAGLELFFPAQGGTAKDKVAQAKALCRRCPFEDPCREYAVTGQGVPGRWVAGVWGGTTEAERDEIRRARRQAAA